VHRLALWNALPGVEKRRKVGDRAALIDQHDPVLLVIKANQRIALRTVIPLEEDADNEQRRDAFRRLREERAALPGDDRYLEAQHLFQQDDRRQSGNPEQVHKPPATRHHRPVSGR
jgi:hypothetical protein